jgi:hypothetical protein
VRAAFRSGLLRGVLRGVARRMIGAARERREISVSRDEDP